MREEFPDLSDSLWGPEFEFPLKTDDTIAKAHLADAITRLTGNADYDYVAGMAAEFFMASDRAADAARLYAEGGLTDKQFEMNINIAFRELKGI